MFDQNTFGLKTNPDPFYEAQQADVLVKPETRAVLGAYVDDVYRGLGSQYADDRKDEIAKLDKEGEALSLGLFEDMGFEGVDWYPGITKESAEVRQVLNKESEKRAVIQNRATTGQSIAGVVTAIGAGVFEEKNVKYGIAGALVASPLYGAAASAIRSTKTAYNTVKRANNIASIAGRGAMDGFVSAALMEPSNRSTANVLQQDYTMMDSMFNVTTSTLFGVAFGAVPEYARNRFAEMRDKAKAREIALDEFETGVSQLATSQKVDISAVEKTYFQPVKDIGTLSAPIQKQIETVNTVAKVLPNEVEVEAPKDLTAAQPAKLEQTQWRDDISPQTKAQLESPSSYVVRQKDNGKTIMETSNLDVIARLNTNKYEAVPVLEHLANLNGKTYSAAPDAEFKAEIVRQAALGEDTIQSRFTKIDMENKAAIQRHVQSITDVLNDTAFPPMAEREPNVEPKNLRQFYNQNFDKYLQELSDDELEFLNNAIDSYNDADIEEAYKNIYSCLTRG